MKLNKGQNSGIAQKVIPGGTMLFSKNPDLQLPTNGQPILVKQKVIKYGILMETNSMIYF